VLASLTSNADVWLPAIGAMVLAIGAVAAAGVGVYEYRLKSRAQTAETHVRLADAFARLCPLANAREGFMVSEAAATMLLAGVDPDDSALVDSRLHGAVVTGPVGRTTQIAAISAIAELARNHPDLLREPGRQALLGLLADVGDPVVVEAVGRAWRRLET
jgi:hypothetical protein